MATALVAMATEVPEVTFKRGAVENGLALPTNFPRAVPLTFRYAPATGRVMRPSRLQIDIRICARRVFLGYARAWIAMIL
jgi:hypothetical protein